MKKPLTPIEKVAILLMSLGEELASELIQKLPEYDAQRILKTLAKIERVDQQTVIEIQEEFQNYLSSPKNFIPDGASAARRIIAKAFDPETTQRLYKSLPREIPQSFRDAEVIDAKTLWQLLMKEHPQTIALILAHLSTKKSGELVALMHPAVRGDVLLRLATLGEVEQEILNDVDEVLSKALDVAKNRSAAQNLGGPRKTAEIIALFSSDHRRELLSQLDSKAPDIASDVRARMFTFEDLQKLDRMDIEKILRKIQPTDLELALRKCPGDIANLFFSAMSERRAEQLRDNIAASKPVAIVKIAEAQQRIAHLTSELIASGEINDPMDEAV